MATKKKRVSGLYVQGISYDSARSIPDMDWKFADSKNADSSLSSDVRKRIRERSRYEVANNSYASGAGTSIVNAVLPKQPKLQFNPISKTKRNDKIAKQLEADFFEWAKEIKLAQKLRSMRFSKFQDGEAFGILYENPRLNTEVKLDLSPIDCERVANPDFDLLKENNVDGIKLDEWGNPVSYTVLTVHPGGDLGAKIESTEYKAERVLHWFRKITPEQHRGVSELSPSLLLFSFLRRYIFSVVRASEISADLALILKTNDQDLSGEISLDSPILEAPFSRGTVAALPEGFDAIQMKAEQPTQQFGTMVDELLGAIGASLGLPRLVMRKSATGFTYASAKVDLSEMERFIAIERDEMNENIVTPLFNAFKREWELVNNIKLPKALISWYYAESLGNQIDPQKEANAQTARLQNGTTTLAREFANIGLDWEVELEQRATEARKLKELGLTMEEKPPEDNSGSGEEEGEENEV